MYGILHRAAAAAGHRSAGSTAAYLDKSRLYIRHFVLFKRKGCCWSPVCWFYRCLSRQKSSFPSAILFYLKGNAAAAAGHWSAGSTAA